jgi:hypothetical protein
MHQLVFTNTCLAIQKTRFISIYVHEVTIMDCQSWFSFHVHGWKHIPILLPLEQVVNGGTSNNFKKVVMGIVDQSEPHPMIVPIRRSIHRMGWMIRLFFIHLFTLR